MNPYRALVTLAAVASIALAPAARAASGPTIGPAPATSELPEVCFAPNTSRDLVESYARALDASRARARGSAGLSVAASQYQDGYRWSYTATNGWGLGQGDPTTITWSVVPDGTPIQGAIGDASAPSNLRAFLNGIYGSDSAWLPLFQQVFDRWAELTGVTYVYEPADDLSQIGQGSASGVLGVRADVRIGGHTIDGNYGVLAYNYYPNNGDMVLDTADAFFTNTTGGSLRLRNTLAHEHGHGLGLPHVCPVNQTKLMEPYLTTSFDGPQHDDVLGINRGYGDDLEHNDAMGSSSDLGALANGTVTVRGLSVDDDGDHDFFQFRVGGGKKASATVTPVGLSYPMGAQVNGSCTAGATYDSRSLNDLAVQILDVDGTTVLGTANASPAGQPETLASVALPSGSATYYARVLGGANNVAQLYDFTLSIDDVVPPPDEIFGDGFDDVDLSSWTASATGAGDLFTASGAALAGARGLAARVDDTTPLWVEDQTPDGEARYRVRFSLDPNGFVPAASKKPVQIFRAMSEQPTLKKLVLLLLRMKNGQHQLRVKVARAGGMLATPWVGISDAPHAIEIDWKKATAAGSADGHLQLWVDGTSVAWLGGLDNPARFVDSARLGAWQLRPTSSGMLYFDRFVSRRSSYIGP